MTPTCHQCTRNGLLRKRAPAWSRYAGRRPPCLEQQARRTSAPSLSSRPSVSPLHQANKAKSPLIETARVQGWPPLHSGLCTMRLARQSIRNPKADTARMAILYSLPSGRRVQATEMATPGSSADVNGTARPVLLMLAVSLVFAFMPGIIWGNTQ